MQVKPARTELFSERLDIQSFETQRLYTYREIPTKNQPVYGDATSMYVGIMRFASLSLSAKCPNVLQLRN